MDYEIINSAIKDITTIVNNYQDKKGYSESLCDTLTIALLGYYLSFGPEIFEKINIALDSVQIYQCPTEEDCINLKERLISVPIDKNDPNPGTYWDYKYDEETKKFIGAKPIIFYPMIDNFTDVFSIVHELSHVIEGINAEVLKEDEEVLTVRFGLAERAIQKNTNLFISKGEGIVELITVAIENKILREFLKLDSTKIENKEVSSFLEEIKDYQQSNVLLRSYNTMAAMFKELIDSDIFFDLIKKHHYKNEAELIKEEFDSLGEKLSFNKISTYADNVYKEDFNNMMYYAKPIHDQMEAFNEATGAKPEKKLIIIV